MTLVETASRYRWVILGLCVLIQCAAAMVAQVLAPLTPLFLPELGLTKTEVGLFTSAALAGGWSVLLAAGSLTDRFGVRKLVVLGLAVAGGFLVLMSLTRSILQAAVVMFVAGMGRGAVFPGSTTAITDWFPTASRAMAMGLTKAASPAAGILAAVALPTLGLLVGWRAAIAVIGLGIIAIAVVTALAYRDPNPLARTRPSRPSVRASLSYVLRSRLLWTLAVMASLMSMAQQGLSIYLALYLNEIVLVSLVPNEPARIVAAGGYLAVCQMGGVLGRLTWGVVSDRVFRGGRTLALAVSGALSAATLLAVGRLDTTSPVWLVTGLVFVAGVSAIGWNGVYHTLVTENVSRSYSSTAVGFCGTMLEAGNTAGPPLFGFTVDLTASYAAGWFLLSALCVGGTLLAILASRTEEPKLRTG